MYRAPSPNSTYMAYSHNPNFKSLPLHHHLDTVIRPTFQLNNLHFLPVFSFFRYIQNTILLVSVILSRPHFTTATNNTFNFLSSMKTCHGHQKAPPSFKWPCQSINDTTRGYLSMWLRPWKMSSRSLSSRLVLLSKFKEMRSHLYFLTMYTHGVVLPPLVALETMD